jgi:hypothetical protein
MLVRTVSPVIVPTFCRESVKWHTVAPGWVEIVIDLHNSSSEESSPDNLVIESARLGAFVPFRPVTRVAVPALAPGERRRVSDVLSMNDLGERDMQALRLLNSPGEWIGNLHVYFEKRPEYAVEVHRALNLDLQMGVKNHLMIEVARAERCGVQMLCSNPEWHVSTWGLSDTVCLEIMPPALRQSTADLTVLVTRQRDGRTVPVEFSFRSVEGTSAE